MPTKKLTDLFVERAKAPTRGRLEYFDASFPGLALRVTANGGKSWSMFYRFGGRLRRFTIGAYPAIKPAQARREATAALERVRQGFDPAEEKRARRDNPRLEADTFAALAYDYLERHLQKNNAASTYQEAKRDLFNWAIEKDRLSASPVARMKLPTKERPRDRVLSDDELRWFWCAAEEIDWPFGPLAQLLLLTAQRRDEVAGMEACT